MLDTDFSGPHRPRHPVQPVTIGEGSPRSLQAPPESEVVRRWPADPAPLVSVLCSTYNHKLYLAKALDGVLAQQTSFPFEIIVRDDGSSDGTLDILKDYSNRYPRIIRAIIEPQNTFLATGLCPWIPMAQRATGLLIAFCDGDDYWIDPHKLQDQADVLLQHQDVSLVSTAFATVREGRTEEIRAYSGKQLAGHRVSSPILPSTWMFRAAQADLQSDVFNRLLNADNLLLSQLTRVGGTRHMADRVSVIMHRHAHSAFSGTSLDRHSQRMFQIVNSQLWIAEYHRRSGAKSVSREQLRHAVHKWHGYLESVGPSHPALFATYAMLLVLKRVLRRTSS